MEIRGCHGGGNQGTHPSARGRPMVGYLANVIGTGADTIFTRYYRGKDLVSPMSIEPSRAIGFGLVRPPLVRFWIAPERIGPLKK